MAAFPAAPSARVEFLCCLDPATRLWWTQERHFAANGRLILSKNCTPLDAPYRDPEAALEAATPRMARMRARGVEVEFIRAG